MENNIKIRQLFEKETSTFTYLIWDEKSREAVLIDTTKGFSDRDLKLIEELKLKLIYTLDTHVHADHVTASADIRKKTGAKIVMGEGSGAECADILLKEGDKIRFGEFEIEAISTPGHTDGCTSYKIENYIFTGDTLLIRSVGRTDFQQGSAEKLHDSLSKIFKLPKDTIVMPGHDYNGHSSSTLGEERMYNKFASLIDDRENFVKTLNARELPLPKYIDIAVPSNLICGEEIISAKNE